MPEGIGPFPPVVIAINGGSLDALELAVSDILAADGYIAAAPGIFHGQDRAMTQQLAERRSR
ncbi:MAG: hypothetical protein ACJ0HN_07295 [Alphaproteobacteria bacterium]